MRRLPVFALLVALSLALLLPAGARAGEWEQIYVEDAVTVYRQEVPGTRLVAFKGDTVFDAPIGRVLDVLLDDEHRTDWVSRLYISRVLERRGDFDYVIYQAFALPAVFANRDYVYRGRASRDPANGDVILQIQSTEHPDAPETVGVRAELVNSRYVLRTLDAGRTRVEVEIMTDPKGMMPAWLVNLIQKSWPLDTLNGIRGQLDQPWVGEHPLPGEPTPAETSAAEAPDASAPEAPAAE